VENPYGFVYTLSSIKYSDKAKPFARKGQKATGLNFCKTAVLPKDDMFGLRGFLSFKD